MVSLSKATEGIPLSVTKIGSLGDSLPLLRGIQCRQTNSLNLLAFSFKSDTSLQLMRRGGITGIFLPLKMFLKYRPISL